MGFKALGLDTFPAENSAEAHKILRHLTRDSEEEFKESPTPAIIVIPGREGSIGYGQEALKSAVERAVGTNILGD